MAIGASRVDVQHSARTAALVARHRSHSLPPVAAMIADPASPARVRQERASAGAAWPQAAASRFAVALVIERSAPHLARSA